MIDETILAQNQISRNHDADNFWKLALNYYLINFKTKINYEMYRWKHAISHDMELLEELEQNVFQNKHKNHSLNRII